MEPQVLHLPINWLQFWVSAGIFVLSGVAAVLKVGYDLAQHEQKLKTDLTNAITNLDSKFTLSLNAAIDSGDKKRARIYERFDEYKNFTEGTFVRKDMCGVLHNSTAHELVDIKTEMRTSITALSEKIDTLKNLILGTKKEGV